MSGARDIADLSAGFRTAMRGLASTVCVVTTTTEEGPRGMTLTAVMSLSVEPPTLALAINRSARLNPALQEGTHLAIHLLGEGQADLAKVFAGGRPPGERFPSGSWRPDAWGCPVLTDASASLSGVVVSRIETATHTLLIVEVAALQIAPDARPLLYAQGDYGRFADAREAACPSSSPSH